MNAPLTAQRPARLRPTPRRRTLTGGAWALSFAAALWAVPAGAHDSWFDRAPGTAGPVELTLGTGNRFPQRETAIDPVYLARQGCRRGDSGAPLALRPAGLSDTALRLRTAAGASTCWAQLSPLWVTLAPDLVAPYLQEIQASAEVRRIWAERAARGLPWRERYTKHARIELQGARPEPTPLGLDLLLNSAGQPLQTGQLLLAQALRDGQPLAGLALEWRHEDSPLGIWQRTDAQGRVRFSPPLPGRWLLRGVDLRVADDDSTAWDSRFVTLAFSVSEAAR